MDFGVTEKGFVLKSFADIMKDIENGTKQDCRTMSILWILTLLRGFIQRR